MRFLAAFALALSGAVLADYHHGAGCVVLFFSGALLALGKER